MAGTDSCIFITVLYTAGDEVLGYICKCDKRQNAGIAPDFSSMAMAGACSMQAPLNLLPSFHP